MLICADARAIPLRDECVDCCVTSPPYWGLRDYGTARWEGGADGCAHRVPATGSTQNKGNNNKEGSPFGDVCGLCGASRIDAQIGLERTPEEYVATMVHVFREVRRVLKPAGTLWLNLGDSYAASGKGGDTRSGFNARYFGSGNPGKQADTASQLPTRSMPSQLKPKDLVGIPWRVAFALQADGWWLRSDVIWSKPNPMPESVTDRPTKAHEYVFLMAKSERYYFGAVCVREPDKGLDHRRRVLDGQPSLEPTGGIMAEHGGLRTVEGRNGSGRNVRTVWTIPATPYPGAHFATFPEALAKRCILAGCPSEGIVLDPFCGSGTTVRVARSLGRHGIGLDLSMKYLTKNARERIRVTQGLGL